MTGIESQSISETKNECDSRDISGDNACSCGLLRFQNLPDTDRNSPTDCAITSRIRFLLKNYLKHSEAQRAGAAAKSRMNLVVNDYSKVGNAKTIAHLRNHAKQELLLRKLHSTKREYNAKPYVKFKSTANMKNKHVKTLEELEALISELRDCEELAVNLDYRQADFFGLSWLLQLSTPDTNYFVNAVALRDDLHTLNAIFMDRKVMKIFYSAKYSVARLKVDFNLFAVNIFDVESAHNILLKSALPNADKLLLRSNFSAIDERHTHLLTNFKCYLINLLLKLYDCGVFKLMHRQFRSLSKENHEQSQNTKENDFIYLYKRMNVRVVSVRELYVVGKMLKWRRIVGNRNKILALNYILSADEIVKFAKLYLNDEGTSNKYKHVEYFVYDNDITLNVREVVEEAKRLPDKQVEVLKYYEIINASTGFAGRDSLSKLEYEIPAEKIIRLRITLSDRQKRNLAIKMKPQLSFKDAINNVSTCLPVSRLTRKPNAMVPLKAKFEGYKSSSAYHPYRFELDHFAIPRRQLAEVVPPVRCCKPIEKTLPFYYVKTLPRLQNVARELDDFDEIAVDLKYCTKRSYLGYTSLLLISTRVSDYAIDAISLRAHLHVLNGIFTRREVLKVFCHDAHRKIQWLQKDLSLYVVNMFDISRAIAILSRKERADFSRLMPDKAREFDWRERPLTREMRDRLRMATRYSLFAKDVLSNELSRANLLESFYNCCRGACKVTYRKPVFEVDSYKAILKEDEELRYSGHFVRINVVKELNKWRDAKAREVDENPGYVLSNGDVLRLARLLPSDRQVVRQACCDSEMSKKYVSEIFKAVKAARNMKNSANSDQCYEYGFQDDEENDAYIYENEDAVMSLPMMQQKKNKVKRRFKIVNDDTKIQPDDVYRYSYDAAKKDDKKCAKRRFMKKSARDKAKAVRYCRSFKEGCRNDHLNAYNDVVMKSEKKTDDKVVSQKKKSKVKSNKPSVFLRAASSVEEIWTSRYLTHYVGCRCKKKNRRF